MGETIYRFSSTSRIINFSYPALYAIPFNSVARHHYFLYAFTHTYIADDDRSKQQTQRYMPRGYSRYACDGLIQFNVISV